MWSGPGGWGQFPLQQSAYANIPSEEELSPKRFISESVDWASLAKQWIAQRDVMTSSTSHGNPSPVMYMSTSAVPPPPPPLPTTANDNHLPSTIQFGSVIDGAGPMLPNRVENNNVDNSNSQDSVDSGIISQVPVGQQNVWDNWGNAGWSMPTWAVPPPPPPDQDHNDGAAHNNFHQHQQESYFSPYEYNQNMHDFYEQPFANNAMASGGFPYWNDHQQMQIPHLMNHSSSGEYRSAPRRGFLGPSANVPSLMDDSLLDASKRKNLPAWIREGLEKMEREKLKQMEREKMMQDLKNPNKFHEDNNDNRDVGQVLAVKSRFDSDNENEDNSDDEENHVKQEPAPEIKKASILEKKEEAKVLSEEEKQMQIMMRVRQMLTEVLLDVTGSEIADIASSVYKSAKAKQAKAPAKQLARSSALASITALGLGYDSEVSDDENSEQGNGTPAKDVDSDLSDDDTYKQRISQKKLEFERKMRLLEESEHDAIIRANVARTDAFVVKRDTSCDENTELEGVNINHNPRQQGRLVSPPSSVAHNRGASSGSAVEDNDHKMKRKSTSEKMPNDSKEEFERAGGHEKRREHQSSVESSSDSESSENVEEMRDRNRSKEDSTSKRSKHSKESSRTHKSDSRTYKSDHSSKKSREVSRKSEEGKHKYEYGNSESAEDRLGEQLTRSSRDSRRRSSHDKDEKKRTISESHKRKRTRNSESDERLVREHSSSFKHKRRQRSSSSSESSSSRRKSHRRHKSDDKRHRRRSVSRSREEVPRHNHGKKSRARRKSRSSSRSSDDH